MTNAIREALAYACDCSLAEVAEALLLYGQYPRDGLGRKVNAAEEMAETCRIALASLEQASTPSVEAVRKAVENLPYAYVDRERGKGRIVDFDSVLRAFDEVHPPIPAPESAEAPKLDVWLFTGNYGVPFTVDGMSHNEDGSWQVRLRRDDAWATLSDLAYQAAMKQEPADNARRQAFMGGAKWMSQFALATHPPIPALESAEPVAWFKHGPYEGDEPLVCVFDDPHDEDCYTPLYTQPPIPAPESAEPKFSPFVNVVVERVGGAELEVVGRYEVAGHDTVFVRLPESAKGAEQPAPQTESGADALREVLAETRHYVLAATDVESYTQRKQAHLVLQKVDTALAAAEPTNSKGAEQAAETLRRLATEALAWMDSSVTDKPYSLCRDLRAALASPPTQEGDGARERVSASKEARDGFETWFAAALGSTNLGKQERNCVWMAWCAASHQAGDRPESVTDEVEAIRATKALPAGVERDAEFEVWEGEGDSTTMAAGCSGPRADAWREAKHYAFQYAQDGPVRICEITRRWVSPDEVFATSSAEPPR